MIMSRSMSHVYEPAAGAADRMIASQPLLLFDRDSIRALDVAATQEYGIPGIVLMENAARGAAEQAMFMLEQSADSDPSVLIICGSGNNGGDGYATARHLHNRGVRVAIARLGDPSAGSDAEVNRAICRNMGLVEFDSDELSAFFSQSRPALIIDALFGTGLTRTVSGKPAEVIDVINRSGIPILSVDVPSGIDCNTGEPMGAAVRAARTVTFVGLKIGFIGLDAQKLLGEVVVADIGAPVELARRFGQPAEPSHPETPEHESHGRLHARRPGQ